MLLRDLIRPARYRIDRTLFRRGEHGRHFEAWRNRFAGRPMLIVGNGPSLNATPLQRFPGVPSIGMNKINLLFERSPWRPSLIVCNNPLVARQNQEFFRTTDIPVFVSWKARWFVSRDTRSHLQYFLETADDGFSRDPSVSVSSGATVTYTALQLAFFLGASPVILFGIDHSFSATGKANRVVVNQGKDSDHFDPNYFANGNAWMLPDLDASEVAYQRARQAFESDGRIVYDATVGGKLQIFPKISVARAVQLCGVQ